MLLLTKRTEREIGRYACVHWENRFRQRELLLQLYVRTFSCEEHETSLAILSLQNRSSDSSPCLRSEYLVIFEETKSLCNCAFVRKERNCFKSSDHDDNNDDDVCACARSYGQVMKRNILIVFSKFVALIYH